MYHPGPVNVYLAKAPSTAAAFNGKGNVWFKIFNDQPRTTASEISWPNYSMPFSPSPRFVNKVR